MQKKHPIAVGASAPAPLLVDIPTAAKMLSTTVWQIRELVWAKKLPVIKLGRRFLFRPADLVAFANKLAGAA
jgi:excisionase family DNA binding protein